MREVVRYLTAEKLELFLKIPFLLHINAPGYPGYVDAGTTGFFGIFNFEQSGFFKTAMKQSLFPKSIQEHIKVDKPLINALYHIGSLGTFTQGAGSDFDYWVMVDKKRFSHEMTANLNRKLDSIVRYSREKYQQQVTFFIMDSRTTGNDHLKTGPSDDIIGIPKVFLKEEFYRTYLMIAGKIPLWSVLPQQVDNQYDLQRMTRQVLSMHTDIIDLGQLETVPFSDILKGLLWHICKSVEDPIKALIKATLIFSYRFGRKEHRTLLCESIKKRYVDAGIDDYSVDPYKAVFDRILEYHSLCDPDGIHLIKNAVFFRLCEYPNVKLPQKGSPKHQLLTHYMRNWRLKNNQIDKLLAYESWSESEKLLLEKAVLQRLAQMFNLAMQQTEQPEHRFDIKNAGPAWEILKNKTRMRLYRDKHKIPSASTYLKSQNINLLVIEQISGGWRLSGGIQNKDGLTELYTHKQFAMLFGWVLENSLYRRRTAQFKGRIAFKLFDTPCRTVGFDALYLAASPVKPLSERVFLKKPVCLKQLVFLFFNADPGGAGLFYAELLFINSWGELYTDEVCFDRHLSVKEKLTLLVDKMSQQADQGVRLLVYQFTAAYVQDIDFDLKKMFENATGLHVCANQHPRKPYLDRI